MTVTQQKHLFAGVENLIYCLEEQGFSHEWDDSLEITAKPEALINPTSQLLEKVLKLLGPLYLRENSRPPTYLIHTYSKNNELTIIGRNSPDCPHNQPTQYCPICEPREGCTLPNQETQ